MNPASTKKDRKTFLDALTLWDRPEEELYGQPLSSDCDTDAFVDRAFGIPSAGVIRD